MWNNKPNLTERWATAESLTNHVISTLRGSELSPGMADRIILATLACVSEPRGTALTGQLAVRRVHDVLLGVELSPEQGRFLGELALARVKPRVTHPDDDSNRLVHER